MLKSGDYVIYGGAGVCRVAAFEEKSFDGVHFNEYCRLAPVFDANSVFYVPSAKVEASVRALLSREEVLGMICSIPKTEPLRISTQHSRKEVFEQILKSGDPTGLIPMIMLLHNEKAACSSGGKKPSYADQRAMNDAKELMCQEFSVVLGIDKSAVMQYIEESIGCSIE